jgi:hypothetical protein
MLFALPVGAFIANSSIAVSVYAEESVTGNEAGTTDDSSSSDDASDSGSTDEGTDTTVENPSGGDNSGAGDGSNTGDSTSENESGDGENGGETGEDDPTPTPEPTPEPEPECICDHKCSQYDYNKDCPVCSENYKDCEYKEPSVKITINTPSGWYSSGTSAKVTFKVEDILDTGNFAIKSVKAKIGQNGSYNDVTEDMFLEISENCTVYVLVTDANDQSYERSRSIKCFDASKPTLNAAVSDGLLTIQASDNDSGVKVIYVNGYEFTDVTNGTVNIRLSQFDAGYEYFTITAMDNAGNVSEVYKTKNPYYKDPNSDDDSNPAEQLPASAEATKPSSATATVTDHTTTDSNGNTTSTTSTTTSTNTSPEAQKKAEFAKADAEEAALSDGENGEDMNLGKEFYTIEAASGKVFYLIIDRDGQEEMVYFLTEITENDLLNVTTDNSETLPKNSAALESQIPVTESALPNNNTDIDDTHEVETPTETPEEPHETEPEKPAEEEPEEPVKSNPLLGYIIMAIFGGGVIGAAYYFKVVKKKQDGDFVEDEDEEAEEEVYADDADEQEKDEDAEFLDRDYDGEQVNYPEPTAEQKDRPAPTAEDMEDATIADTEEGSVADVSEKDE